MSSKAAPTLHKRQTSSSVTTCVLLFRATCRSWSASLSNWEKYYHSDDDPLVRLAIVHAQFEFLHPFLDGNGRIGRILVPIFLFEKALLSEPTFYMSEYFEENRDEYIDRLNALNRSKVS